MLGSQGSNVRQAVLVLGNRSYTLIMLGSHTSTQLIFRFKIDLLAYNKNR